MSEKNSFNNNSSENHQLVNKNGNNILNKEPKVGIFKTSDYDLNRNQRQVNYEDYDHVLCEKCHQEINKYFYCESCYNKETDDYEKIRMEYGRLKVGNLNYDLDLDERKT